MIAPAIVLALLALAALYRASRLASALEAEAAPSDQRVRIQRPGR